jgi:hypothetical protein
VAHFTVETQQKDTVSKSKIQFEKGEQATRHLVGMMHEDESVIRLKVQYIVDHFRLVWQWWPVLVG